MKHILCAVALWLLAYPVLAQGDIAPPDQWSVRLETAGGPVEAYLGTATAQSDGGWELRFNDVEPAPPPGVEFQDFVVTLEGTIETQLEAELEALIQSEPFDPFNADLGSFVARSSNGDRPLTIDEFNEAFGGGIREPNWLNFSSMLGWASNRSLSVTGVRFIPTLALDGFRFEMTNPSLSQNGNRIEWEWSASVTGEVYPESVLGGPQHGTALIWERLPQIDFVFVANAQQAFRTDDLQLFAENSPLYPPRFGPVAEPVVLDDDDEHRYQRHLIVIGRNLGGLDGETPTDTAPGLTYGSLEDFDAGSLFEQLHAYHPLSANMVVLEAAARFAGNGDLDVRVLPVTVDDVTPAGVQTFTLGGSRQAWPLQYGEFRAQILPIRPQQSAFMPIEEGGRRLSPGRSIISDHYIFREEVVFEARFEIAPPVEELTVLVDGTSGLADTNQPDDGPREITLTRTADFPSIFVSQESYIIADGQFWHDPEGAALFDLENFGTPHWADAYEDIDEDVAIRATNNAELRLDFVPGQGVELAPEHQNYLVHYADTSISSDFHAALRLAYACNHAASALAPWDDLTTRQRDDLARQETTPLWMFAITGENTLPLTYGQHAALLIARDRLREIIEADIATHDLFMALGQRVSDVQSRLAYDPAEPIPELVTAIRDNLTGASNSLTPLLGQEGVFERMVEGRASFAALQSKAQQALARDYAVSAAYPVAAAYNARLSALRVLRDTDDCEVRTLIRVGIDGITPIIFDVGSNLTREEQVAGGPRIRRPDTIGRREMFGLIELFERYDIRQTWSNEEWLYLKGAVGASGLALGGAGFLAASFGVTGTGVTALAYGAIAVDVTDWFLACTDYYCANELAGIRQPLAQAFSGELGRERAHAFTDAEINHVMSLMDIAMAAGGAYFSISELGAVMRRANFLPVANELLTAARQTPVPSLTDARRVRPFVRRIMSEIAENPARIGNLSAGERDAILLTLRDQGSSPLPAALRAFLGATPQTGPDAGLLRRFFETGGELSTIAWDVNNLRQTRDDLRKLQNPD